MGIFSKLFGSKEPKDTVEFVKGEGNTIVIQVNTHDLNRFDDFSIIVKDNVSGSTFDFGSYINSKDEVKEVEKNGLVPICNLNLDDDIIPYDHYYLYVESKAKGLSEAKIQRLLEKMYPNNSYRSIKLMMFYARNAYLTITGDCRNDSFVTALARVVDGKKSYGNKAYYGAVRSVFRAMRALGLSDKMVLPKGK